MEKIEIFIEKEKRTPELMKKVQEIIDEWCEVVNKNEKNNWFIECLTEKSSFVEEELEALSAEFPNVLISDRVRDMEWNGNIWQTWFLNGTSDWRDATIIFPEPDRCFIGAYMGAVK